MHPTTKWTQLCRRTDYPKLGYIIHRLRELGIATRFNGKSFHADHILEVDSDRLIEAWDLLCEQPQWPAKIALDDMPDDHPMFYAYVDVKPDQL